MLEKKMALTGTIAIYVIFCLIFLLLLSACGPTLSEDIQKQRQDYVKKNQDLDQIIKLSIMEGRVCLGMTPEQVAAATGYKPSALAVWEGSILGRTIQYGRYEVGFDRDKIVRWYQER